MQQRQKSSEVGWEMKQFRDFFESLKIQSSFGLIITERLAIIVQRYLRLAPQLQEKQKELKTLFLYNTKLVQILQNFGDHEKRILARLHSLEQLNAKIIREFCAKKNTNCKFDEYYKPIEAVYPNYQVSKWKFQLKQPIQVDFNSEYNQRLFQMFQKYLLPKQQKLMSIVQQKLKYYAQNSENTSSNRKPYKIQIQQLNDLKQKISKYHSIRQHVQPQNMFNIYQQRKEIIDKAVILKDIANSFVSDIGKQAAFVDEVAKLYAKLKSVSQQDLILILRKENQRQKYTAKQRNKMINQYFDSFQRIIDENTDLKSQCDGLNIQLQTTKQDMKKLRDSLNKERYQSQIKMIKKLARSNSIGSQEYAQEIKKQVQNSLIFQKNVEQLQKRVESLKKNINQLQKELVQERIVKNQLAKQASELKKQKSQNIRLAQNLQRQLNALNQSFQLLRLQNQKDAIIQAYLLPIPYPILIFPKIDVQLPSETLSVLRNLLNMKKLIPQGEVMDQQQLIKIAINIINDFSKQSQKAIEQFKQLTETKQKIIYQKQIQYREVVKEIEVIKIQFEKVSYEKQLAVTRMNKSQDLACQATSIILDTALKGPQFVIREIEAALEQIKELLRADDIEIQSPHKYRQPVYQAQLRNSFEGSKNIQSQNRGQKKGERQNRNRTRRQQQRQGQRFSFNKDILLNQAKQQYQQSEDMMRTSRSQMSKFYPVDQNSNLKQSKQSSKAEQIYRKKNRQVSLTGEAKTQKNEATVPQQVQKQGMKNTILAREQSHTGRPLNPFNSTHIQRTNNQPVRPSSSSQDKPVQETRKSIHIGNKNKPSNKNYEESQFQRANTPKKIFIKNQNNKQQQGQQQVGLIKKSSKTSRQLQVKVQTMPAEKQSSREDLINSSKLSAIHKKVTKKGNDSVENLLRNGEQQSSQQQRINQKQEGIKYNGNIQAPIQTKSKRSSRVFQLGDLNSPIDPGPGSPAFFQYPRNAFSIEAQRLAPRGQQAPQNYNHEHLVSSCHQIVVQEKSYGQTSIKGQKQLQILKKKYRQLLQKKLQLDRKLESKFLQPDQSEIKEFLKKMREFQIALQQAQAVNKKYKLDYQNFLQDLKDSGQIDTRQQVQQKIFFLVKRVKQLQKIIEQQKIQFESTIRNQLRKSQNVAFQIMKQFQQNQLQQSRRLSGSVVE